MNALETGLYTKLAAASLGGTVYNSRAVSTATFPYVVFSMVSGVTDDSNTADGITFEYDVKAVDRDVAAEKGPKDAGVVAELIDTALHHQSLTIAGWNCTGLRRVARIKYHDGEAWHVGGTYRIRIQEA